MKIVGIISEYDPFHNGHKYQCDKLREMGAEKVISIMGGIFSQRGSVYILDKYTRAECAVASGGADIVLELPYPFSASCAESFAQAGVHIASKYCDSLAFGCECDDGGKLIKIAKALLSDEFAERHKRYIQAKQNDPLPILTEEIIREMLGDEFSEIIKLPNNILAIEYLKAIYKGGYALQPVFIKRKGAMHADNAAVGVFASSTHIRSIIFNEENIDSVRELCPEHTFNALLSAKKNSRLFSLKHAEKAILHTLRWADFDTETLSECGGGLGKRLLNNASFAESLDDLYEISATKRYTNARIRRAVLSLLFRSSKKSVSSLPEFTALLSAKRDSINLIKNSEFPLLSMPSDIRSLPDTELIRLYLDSERFVSLCTDTATNEYGFFKKHPVILE